MNLILSIDVFVFLVVILIVLFMIFLLILYELKWLIDVNFYWGEVIDVGSYDIVRLNRVYVCGCVGVEKVVGFKCKYF